MTHLHSVKIVINEKIGVIKGVSRSQWKTFFVCWSSTSQCDGFWLQPCDWMLYLLCCCVMFKEKTVCASLNILWDNIILAYSYLSLKQLSCPSPHEPHSWCQVTLNESYCDFIVAAISMVFVFLFRIWWNADWSKVKIASIWCYTF